MPIAILRTLQRWEEPENLPLERIRSLPKSEPHSPQVLREASLQLRNLPVIKTWDGFHVEDIHIAGRLVAGRSDYLPIAKKLALRAQDLGRYGAFSFNALFDRTAKGREKRTMVHFVSHPDSGFVIVSYYVDECGDLPAAAALCADAMVDVGFVRSQIQYDPSQARQIEHDVRFSQIKCNLDAVGPGAADQLFGIMKRIGVEQIHKFDWHARNFGKSDGSASGDMLYDQIVNESFVADSFEVDFRCKLLAEGGLRVCREFSGGSEHGLFTELGTFKRGRKKVRVLIHAAADGYRVVLDIGRRPSEEELSSCEHMLGEELELVWLPNRRRR